MPIIGEQLTRWATTHRRRLRQLRWFSLIPLIVTVAPGCKTQPPPAAPTSVGQGELYETGNPVYDEYFRTVHQLHAAFATGGLEERDARTSLAAMLGLLPTASSKQVLRKLREQADELPPISMEFGVEGRNSRARVELIHAQGADDETKNLVLVMNATAKADLALADRMGELPERSHRMGRLAQTLIEGIDKDFADETPAQRERIRRELNASLDVLVVVADGARDVQTKALEFLEGVQEVLRTTADNKPKGKERAPHP